MIERKITPLLKKYLVQAPILTLMGPRQSGKTTLCRATFPEKAYVSLEDPQMRDFAKNDPKGFLARYPAGAIFDEIQRTPDLPSYLQGIVDEKKTKEVSSMEQTLCKA